MPADGPTSTPHADVDLLVVGAGPSGLYAAYYAGFRGLSVAVLDSLEEPGGQLTALYPEKLIYDVAGFPAVRGRDLVDALVEQAAKFDPLYLLGKSGESLRRDGDRFVVGTGDGGEVRARAIVVTAGMGTFTPRPLPGAAHFAGPGIHYFVRDPTVVAGLDVLIVGGGDSALDWALHLQEVARSVTLVHRRESFRGHEGSLKELLATPATVLTPYEVAEVRGDTQGVRAVDVVHKKTGEHRVLDVQAVVAALGFVADLGALSGWGMRLHQRRIVVDTTMATSVPGIFAAGDITEYPGKVRLISVGFGEAATAVNNAAVLIDPSAKLFPGHSSDTGH